MSRRRNSPSKERIALLLLQNLRDVRPSSSFGDAVSVARVVLEPDDRDKAALVAREGKGDGGVRVDPNPEIYNSDSSCDSIGRVVTLEPESTWWVTLMIIAIKILHNLK